MNNEPKSTEELNEKIDAIIGSESLGYEGSGREEISGESAPKRRNEEFGEDLADNRPSDL